MPRYARFVGDVPDPATPGDYERAGGANFAALTALLASEAPATMGDRIDRMAGRTRRAALSVVPRATTVLGLAGLAAGGADLLGTSLRRAGLAAMGEVVARLELDAAHVLFGHTHRSGPFAEDEPDEWITRTGARLLNIGSWVYDPFLLDSAGPGNPWWPGRAAEVGDRGAPRLVSLLGDLDAADLAP